MLLYGIRPSTWISPRSRCRPGRRRRRRATGRNWTRRRRRRRRRTLRPVRRPSTRSRLSSSAGRGGRRDRSGCRTTGTSGRPASITSSAWSQNAAAWPRVTYSRTWPRSVSSIDLALLVDLADLLELDEQTVGGPVVAEPDRAEHERRLERLDEFECARHRPVVGRRKVAAARGAGTGRSPPPAASRTSAVTRCPLARAWR